MNSLIIIFAGVVTIVGMVLTFRLLVLIIDKKNGDQPVKKGSRQHRYNASGVDPGAWRDLAERAESLNRRLQNLEEILVNEAEKEVEKEEAP